MRIVALRRGAKKGYFGDNSKKTVETLKREIKTTEQEADDKVWSKDYGSLLSMCSEEIDVALSDKQYKAGDLQEALELVADSMKETGIIIAENPLDEEILSNYGNFVLDRKYRYGKIKISTFRHKDFVK